jgi:thiol-disulfide isomerase/thioredoxin
MMPDPQPSSARTWLYVLIAFAVFWIGYLVFFGPRASRPALLENSGMSQPAEYNWKLVDLEDRPVSFSRFKGKPVFLNVWATWCPPCVREMPSIAELATDPRLEGKGVEFVCISVDETSAAVRQFLRGKDWSMTFLRAESTPPVFSTTGIPATFLIAPDGRIAASEVGSANWHEPHVIEFLEKLAARP